MPLIFHEGNTLFSATFYPPPPIHHHAVFMLRFFVSYVLAGNVRFEPSDWAPLAVAARVARATSNHVCTLSITLLYAALCCNEATSVNCSEGWLLHGDDYYTLGPICTRLFFLLLLSLPISFTLLLPNLLLATSSTEGILRTLQASLFSPRHTPVTIYFPAQKSWWLCGSLLMLFYSVRFMSEVPYLYLLKRTNLLWIKVDWFLLKCFM